MTGRRGKTRQRVLYWYRTPPNVRVGREPFDPHVMRALEAQYPDVRFDWDQIRNTPIPSVEPEYWRERRRAERVVRRLQEDEDAVAAADAADIRTGRTEAVPPIWPSRPLPIAGLRPPRSLRTPSTPASEARPRPGGRTRVTPPPAAPPWPAQSHAGRSAWFG